jgi:hypothetical protein
MWITPPIIIHRGADLSTASVDKWQLLWTTDPSAGDEVVDKPVDKRGQICG